MGPGLEEVVSAVFAGLSCMGYCHASPHRVIQPSLFARKERVTRFFRGKCNHKETERNADSTFITTNLYFLEQNHTYLC